MKSPARNARPARDSLAIAALILGVAAIVFSLVGRAPAERPPATASARRVAAQQKQIDSLSKKLRGLKVGCPVAGGVSFGSWCLEASPHPVPSSAQGENDYFYAAQTCAREGGWLPSAAQLIGAAPKASLQSTITDNPATSGAEEFPEASRGIKDKREMTSDLFTTTAGSEAAGSEGVSPGSRGNASQGEPNPVPMPANPVPSTLDYVTVYDNGNQGGFAGGEPVGKAEYFRCAYAVGYQGKTKQVKEG
jgi:hypothetical protein